MPDPTYRHGGTPPAGHIPAVRRGRNVVQVIGIKEYDHWHRLDNARKDAEGIRALFVDRLGFIEVAEPMYDAQATKPAIESLVQEKLLALEPDDRLVFFFAGHGHTEKRQVGARTVKTGYLIPAEAESPEALRFSEYVKLDSLLADIEKLPARHVLLVLDACFSGLALSEKLDVPRSDERYSDDLSQRVSRRLIASAMEEQTARDSGPIEGHSPFTGFLIQGLDSGEADRGKKGFVTGSELGLYVQQEVGRWAGSRQTADFGAFGLDERGELVIPLRGETYNLCQAQDSLAAGDSIYAIGRFARDARRFASAARQYRQAIHYSDLAKRSLPAAELGLAKALLGAGDADGAVSTLQALLDRDRERAPADALLWLGMALAKRQNYAAAADRLEAWRDTCPEQIDALWVSEYVTWLRRREQHSPGRRRALVIGINHYQLETARELHGCVNDAEKLFGPLLVEHCGFQTDDVKVLLEAEAVRANVKAEVDRLRGCKPDDTAIVFFSGHAVPTSDPDVFGRNDQEHVYLLLHDTTNKPGYLTNGVTANELHQWMQDIPAGQKLLVLDTHADARFVKLVQEEGTYDLILASDTAEITYEWWTKLDGEPEPCGVLTNALCRSLLANDPKTITFGTLRADVTQSAQDVTSDPTRFPRGQQTPFFDCVLNRRVFGAEDAFLAAFELSEYGVQSAQAASQLAKSYRRFCQGITADHPRAHAAFGRCLLAMGAVAEATGALEAALRQAGDEGWEVRLGLCRAYMYMGRWSDAHQVLQPCLLSAPSEARGRIEDLARLLQAVQGSQRYALLVDTETGDATAGNLAALREVLVKRWGFDAAHIIELQGKSATQDALWAQCTRIAAAPGEEIALLYYRGEVHRRGGMNWDAGRWEQKDVYLGRLPARVLSGLGADLENLLIVIDPIDPGRTR